MEKENIMTVDIEDFKKSQHILDYIDDDFAIVNSLDGIPYSNDTVRLNCFLIAVCAEGCIQLDINYRTYQLQAGDLLLGLPNTLISRTMLSPKYKIRLAGFSTRFLQRIIKMEKKTWNTAAHIHNNPVKSISEGGDDPVFRFYRDLIVAKINDEPHYYHREVMQHLFSALFCEMLGQLHKEIDAPDKGDSPKEGIKQADYTLRKFVELLSKDKGMHRSVSYYADALRSEERRVVKEEGVSIAHYDMIYLKPLDEELLHEIGRKYNRIITVENGVIKGGFGSAVLEFMADNGYTPHVKRIGVPDAFIEHGSIPELYQLCGTK